MAEVNETRQQKKRRAPDGRMSYPRKRAVTACQLCRMRKIKCDNQFPACGTCLSLEIQCNYQDRTSKDFSTFDPASLAILERLNTAIQLLQSQAHLPNLIENLAALRQSDLPGVSTESPTTHSVSTIQQIALPGDQFSPTQLAQETGTALEEALRGPGNCSNVLEWPIFGATFSTHDLNEAFYNQVEDSQVRTSFSFKGKGIREEDAPVLIQYFLQHVHIKNPILNAATLIDMARDVAEEGFKWDGPSCLVLIACALANLATPFATTRPGSNENSSVDAADYSAAEAYYTAARKRTGLLENSILAVQCTFLLGVYQMYSMRPLKAWMSFNQACAIFQAYFWTRSHQEADHNARRLEQRLYWSCLKSECEMRDEVELSPSGLAMVNLPDIFPSPPGGTPEPDAVRDPVHTARVQQDTDLQKSWFYYLSEIAFRRLKNRISTVLHVSSPASWHTGSLPRLHRLAEELDNQVQRWAEHLPEFFSSIDAEPTDELTYMLMARYFDMQELICRPFLYIVVHAEPSQQHSPSTQSYAQRCIDLHMKLLHQYTVKHRHHGSWYGGRARFINSLMLLAAVHSHRISVPEDWEETFDGALNFLAYWEGEAPDLGAARRILISLRASLTDSQKVD